MKTKLLCIYLLHRRHGTHARAPPGVGLSGVRFEERGHAVRVDGAVNVDGGRPGVAHTARVHGRVGRLPVRHVEPIDILQVLVHPRVIHCKGHDVRVFVAESVNPCATVIIPHITPFPSTQLAWYCFRSHQALR